MCCCLRFAVHTGTFLHSTSEPLQTTKVSTRSQDDVVVVVFVFSRASGSPIPWSSQQGGGPTVWRRAFVESWASFSSTHDTPHTYTVCNMQLMYRQYMAFGHLECCQGLGWAVAPPWGERPMPDVVREPCQPAHSDPQRAAGTPPRGGGGAWFDDQGSAPAKDSLSGWSAYWCGLPGPVCLAVWSSSHTE